MKGFPLAFERYLERKAAWGGWEESRWQMSASGGGHQQTLLGLQEPEPGWSDWNRRDGSGNLMSEWLINSRRGVSFPLSGFWR